MVYTSRCQAGGGPLCPLDMTGSRAINWNSKTDHATKPVSNVLQNSDAISVFENELQWNSPHASKDLWSCNGHYQIYLSVWRIFEGQKMSKKYKWPPSVCMNVSLLRHGRRRNFNEWPMLAMALRRINACSIFRRETEPVSAWYGP